MKTRDIIVGILVVTVFVTAFVLIKTKNKNLKVVPPVSPTIEQKLSAKFTGLKIPVNADKIDLVDVTSGNGLGEAIRTYENGKFSITVLASLVDSKPGYFYQAWMEKDGRYISLGKLKNGKGGYIADFVSNNNYSDYKTVVVSLEKVFDLTPESILLKGSF